MSSDDEEVATSALRWPIMFVFAVYSLSSAFQWIQFAIIPSIFQTYYGVTAGAITWTSTIYMASFIPLVFPATWLIDNTGMKNVALLGSGINAIGTLVKCFAIHPDYFWLAFIGQTISACAQCLILELPPKIAAIWFPTSEIATATSIGVFGNQLGVALGFLIPPMIIYGPVESFRGVPTGKNGSYDGSYPDNWRNDTRWTETVTESAIVEVTSQIRYLFISFAVLCVSLFVLVLVLFKDKPVRPANRASVRRSQTTRTEPSERDESGQFLNSIKEYAHSIVRLLKSGPFVLLVLSYGLNVGVYYALSTLLSQIIKPTFLDGDFEYEDTFIASLDTKIGQMGTFMVVAGLVGSILGGIVLDAFKKFKLTTVWCYMFTLVFMVAFTWMVNKEVLWVDYVFIAALGFFMTGYLPIGFEFGAELTYPESEATSSGLLNCSAQIFGFAATIGCQTVIEYFTPSSETASDAERIEGQVAGGWYANLTMIVCLIVGLALTFMITEDLRRHAAEHAEIDSEDKLDDSIKNNQNEQSKLIA